MQALTPLYLEKKKATLKQKSMIPAVELRKKICCRSASIAAKVAEKAEHASKETRRTPRPQYITYIISIISIDA